MQQSTSGAAGGRQALGKNQLALMLLIDDPHHLTQPLNNPPGVRGTINWGAQSTEINWGGAS